MSKNEPEPTEESDLAELRGVLSHSTVPNPNPNTTPVPAEEPFVVEPDEDDDYEDEESSEEEYYDDDDDDEDE